MNRQKKRGLHSSTFIEVSPNTQQSYTSKSPRHSVSIRTFTLDCSLIFGEISMNKNLSGRYLSLCLNLINLAHRQSQFNEY